MVRFNKSSAANQLATDEQIQMTPQVQIAKSFMFQEAQVELTNLESELVQAMEMREHVRMLEVEQHY